MQHDRGRRNQLRAPLRRFVGRLVGLLTLLAAAAAASATCGPRTHGPGAADPSAGGGAEGSPVHWPDGGAPEPRTGAGGDSDATTRGEDLEAPLPPPLPVEPPPPAECVGDPLPRVAVQVPSAEIAECQDGFVTCSGRLTIRVENCGPAPLVVESIVVSNPPPHEGTMELTFAPNTVIRVGAAVEREGFVSWEGWHSVQVRAIEPDGASISIPAVVAQVTNPILAAAKAECEACRGAWGRWGITGREGCICATSDEGKECRDGADCEGPCLFERFEEVSPGLGVPVGRCSGSVVLFGCNPLIRDGASADPPQPLPGRAPTICVD